MNMKKFSNKEAISFGWNAMKNNLGFFVLTFIIVFGIYLILGFLEIALKKHSASASFIILLLRVFINTVIGMGFIKIALKLTDNMKVEVGDLFSSIHLFFKYLIGTLLVTIIVLIGIILLIVPGIIFALKYQYVPYLIIDKGLGPIEAFKKSGTITFGAKNDLFVLWFVLGLMNIAGLLCLIIGLFATIPTTMIAMAYVYRKLQLQADAQAAIPAKPQA